MTNSFWRGAPEPLPRVSGGGPRSPCLVSRAPMRALRTEPPPPSSRTPMPVSAAIRRYYAEKIFAEMGRDKAPANFRPLPVPAHGLATVEGCRGGGKNILELTVLLDPPP